MTSIAKPTVPEGIYEVEKRFGDIIRDRLYREEKSFYSLAKYLGLDEQELSQAFSGFCPMGTYFRLGSFDKFFFTTPGYYAAVFDNIAHSVLTEKDQQPNQDDSHETIPEFVALNAQDGSHVGGTVNGREYITVPLGIFEEMTSELAESQSYNPNVNMALEILSRYKEAKENE